MMPKSDYKFPVGYYEFHKHPNINYQLNRLVTNGGLFEEVKELGPKIKDFDDWKRELIALADNALSEDRILNAAVYYRAAEFFVSPNDPDKHILYEKFVDLIYQVYEDLTRRKVKIPYENSYLPGYHFKNDEAKGTVVIFGGYDSLIEEFYKSYSYINEMGYEVIVFEGPGQGAALKKNKLAMTHEWEKPVKAVLDHFKLNDVILIGISLGGYLSLRATAFEPRISKVIAFGMIYDFFQVLLYAGGPKIREMAEKLLDSNQVDLFNKIMQKRMKSDLLVNWGVNQGMYVFGVKSPFEYIKKARLFSTANISDKITCDVLLLAGTKDHFIPLEMFYKQIEALKNVRSLTARLFTEQENAASHCQMDNFKLALDVILNWIEQIDNRDKKL
ncbi:MAG: alpha/beta hydrolase [Promethearchaeota archaeon]|nr:MAG: alpha/beta hydrolase [Candidatus Lokiarchaeota archaeon]